MTKRIGIPGWMLGDNSFGVTSSYLEFIYRFGQPVIITPTDSFNPPEIDLLICPGGPDLSPTSYGAIPGFRTQKSSPILEHFDAEILPKYIENKTPTFAICRGMQRIWAMYGGYINQHNGGHEQSKHQYDQCHKLYFTQGYEDYKKLIEKVTSRHHQCADTTKGMPNESGIPDELDVIAYAGTNFNNEYFPTVVEIFKHKELPITGVQFHPEDHDSTDELSSLIIEEYLG